MSQAWTCPFCNKPTTITEYDVDDGRVNCRVKGETGPVSLYTKFIVCPNEECKKLTMYSALISQEYNEKARQHEDKDIMQLWHLIPDSTAKVYSNEIVPKAVIEDYEESCKIKRLSPKASASLARRALQGMIRDFYKKPLASYRKDKDIKGFMTLKQEINAIKDVIEPEVWDAIEAVRNVGNIGAHMEEDVNVIIDVEPGEAGKLIELIEMLIEEWYINRHKRQQRLASVVAIAKEKKEKQDGAKEAKIEEVVAEE